jgi:TRAP-type mannitol/chloroaromatic compound transport system substrate-binding protein
MSAMAWAKMKTDYPNIKVKSFPASVIAAMKKSNNKLLARDEAKNAEFKEVIESQKAYMKKARAWTKISDYLYLNTTMNIKAAK